MKQTFSFRRFGMLARKHYTENRINYIAGLGGYLMSLLLGLYGALRENLPSLSMFESGIVFVAFFVPIAVAKMSFAPYIYPNRQVGAFTLPATRVEKYLFGMVNTLLVSIIAIAGMEVAASLVAPHCAALNDFDFVRSIAGHWFAGLGELLVVMPMFASVTIFACTASRKGNVAIPMIATWAAIALLYALPTLILQSCDGWSVATLEFPAFITTYNNHMDVGNLVFECTTERLFDTRWWQNLILPAVLLVAAWFKFREYETK